MRIEKPTPQQIAKAKKAQQFLKLMFDVTPRAVNDHAIASAYGIKFKQDIEPIPDDIASANLLCFEAYNRMTEEVVFKNEIIKMNQWAAALVQTEDGNLGPEFILLPPGEFCFLPHSFYYGYTRSGRPVDILKSYGKNMFKGIKYPSAPENWKRTPG